MSLVEVAADVGGTHARFALVQRTGDRLELRAFRKYLCAEFSGLGEIIERYGRETGCGIPSQLDLAIAGAVTDVEQLSANLPWAGALDRLEDDFPALRVSPLNDYHAVAVGTQHLDPSDSTPLTEGTPEFGALAVAMGVGTGLGAAIRSGYGDSLRVFPTELGQTRLDAQTPWDLEVLSALTRADGFVRLEQVLSGPGIAATYQALQRVLGLAPHEIPPSGVVARASANDEVALATVQLVVRVLGNLLSNLAVTLKPTGGIFLSGGVTPHLARFLRTAAFNDALYANERMRARIREVPILVVERDDVGILGAAHSTNGIGEP